MQIIKKYLWDKPTLDDVEWVMHTFQRRCDIQVVPVYADTNIFGQGLNRLVQHTDCYVTVQNEKDDVFFKLRYPDAILIEETIHAE